MRNPIEEIASLYDKVHEQTAPALPFTAPLAEGGYDIRLILDGGPKAEADLTVCGLRLRLDWETGLLICGEAQAPLCAEDGRVSLRCCWIRLARRFSSAKGRLFSPGDSRWL